MQITERHSYGIILVTGTLEDPRVLLINQRDPLATEHWTFPKGTPEAGESPLETAVREVGEEVGLQCEHIDADFSYTDSYTFEQDGVRIKKQVTYVAGRPTTAECVIQEKEVLEARWCTPLEARHLLRTGAFPEKAACLDAFLASGVIARLFSAN